MYCSGGLILISQEKFKDYLDIIRDLYDKEAKFSDVLEELCNGEGYAFIYSTPMITMINMLSDLCDLQDSDIISYYCFELDFGRSPMSLNCIEDNGVNFSLTNPDELYNFIIGQ